MFWTALGFMILGLMRHLIITISDTVRAVRRAGDKHIPYREAAAATLKWLMPISKARNRWWFSLTTLMFHVSIILVPIFLVGHIALWKRGTGLSWPAIPNAVADVLTILVIVSAAALVVQRAGARASRCLSRFRDYAILVFVMAPFVSGFLTMHPRWNPFPYEAALLAHVISANVLLMLVPITKICHCVLLPVTQLISTVGWYFPPDAGSKVAAALKKEGKAI